MTLIRNREETNCFGVFYFLSKLRVCPEVIVETK